MTDLEFTGRKTTRPRTGEPPKCPRCQISVVQLSKPGEKLKIGCPECGLVVVEVIAGD
jgi:endogenous inhibitor of DNA gyrase (YacG/DUF329 family)